MANEKHLAIILKQGVDAWNEWRKANANVLPDLSGADLTGANLTAADLEYADLSFANLEYADFSFANLSEAKLMDGTLFNTNFSEAILNEVSFWRADLSEANLEGGDLRNVYLADVKLTGTNLSGANIESQDLSYINLSHANLTTTRSLDTNFTGATLTGACVQDWHINTGTNLKDVICDYVYLKCNPDTKEFQERRPHTGNFAPGEFTKLCQQSFDTIDLIFREGLDWKAFAYSLKQVEVLHEDAHLEVRSIENKGDGVVIVKVATTPDADKALIHTAFTQLYEATTKAIAAQNDFSNTQDLAQAASQIQALLAQLQQQGQSPEDAQQQVANDLAEQAKSDPTTLGKLVTWGQKLGDATVTDVVKGVVKMALRAAGVRLP